MHDITAPENYIARDLAESNEVLGKECSTCLRALKFHMFRRDSSMRDGYSLRCTLCEKTPRLSTAEHTSRLRESNNSSEGTKRQRFADQEEYKNFRARIGRPMTHTQLLDKVKSLTDRIYYEQGGMVGDLALYQVFGEPQPHLEGKQFRYIGYCPTGILPEFGIYEFDEERDILIREKARGWRTVLLNLIKHNILTEEQVNEHFGYPAHGEAGFIYRRELWRMRNHKQTA